MLFYLKMLRCHLLYIFTKSIMNQLAHLTLVKEKTYHNVTNILKPSVQITDYMSFHSLTTQEPNSSGSHSRVGGPVLGE